jgi:class 3 adenylate cyclase
MEERDMKRKLATIMVADIVGFSRLAATNEDWTIRTLGEFRRVVDEIIARHDGRIFNTGGDSVLAEFASPVEAVRCAVDFQEAARSRNLLQPRDRQLRFRIGINIGDVMVRGNDLLGDGVNVAARLEGLAEHGGICVSGTVWDHIQGKLSIGYVDIGEQSVKNIPRPVRAYHLRVDGSSEEIATPPIAAPAKPSSAVGDLAEKKRNLLVPTLIAVLAAIFIGAGATVWALWPHERSGRIAQAPEHNSAEPVHAPPVVAQPRADETPTSAPPALLPALLARLAAVVPALSEQERENAVREYANSPVHKAQAVSLSPSGFWTSWNGSSAEKVGESALEGCQVYHGHPCLLIVVDDVLQPILADGKTPSPDMPRVGYAGNFDPDQIPAVGDAFKKRGDITNYSAAPGPKAASFHPVRGRMFIVTQAASQHAAEEQALKACNDDTASKGFRGLCFLYAVDNHVVLPLRLRYPLTAAAK